DELRGQRVGDARVNRRAEDDDPLGQQVRVDVHDSLAARVIGDDIGDRVAAHAAPPLLLVAVLTVGRSPNGRFVVGMSCANVAAMASMNPYSRASGAVYQWSCLESSKIRSAGWPVSSAIRPSTVSLVRRRSAACSSTSTAEPPIPADPWCMRIRECGSAYRL